MIQASLIFLKHPSTDLDESQLKFLRTLSLYGEVWMASCPEIPDNVCLLNFKLTANAIAASFIPNSNTNEFHFTRMTQSKLVRFCDFDYFLDLPKRYRNRITHFWNAELCDS